MQLGDIGKVGRNPPTTADRRQLGALHRAAAAASRCSLGEIAFDRSTLGELSRLVAERTAEAGLAVPRRIDLVVAAGEIARNSGEGSLYLWSDGRGVLCEIHGHGPLDGPLGDREGPRESTARIGICLQLCDLVQVRSGPGSVTPDCTCRSRKARGPFPAPAGG